MPPFAAAALALAPASQASGLFLARTQTRFLRHLPRNLTLVKPPSPRLLPVRAMSSKEQYTPEEIRNMSKEDQAELAERAKTETVVEGGTGGKSLEAQMHLKEGRSKGGQSRAEELGSSGYAEMGSQGGQTRAEQMGREGYQEMGRKGGLSTAEKSGEERAKEEGIEIDESKYRTK